MGTPTPTLWLSHFPNCITLPCGNCKFSLTQHHHHLLQPTNIISLPFTHRLFHVRASQTNNTTSTRIRRSRRLKSDTEICNDIRQFLASVGLPEDHIPSTKELLHHGRNDLANIVRRRGHKQIQDLLTSSLHAGIDSLNAGKSLDERLGAANDCEDLLTGQNEKVDSLVGNSMAATEFLQGNSSGSMYTHSTLSLDESTSTPAESLANSYVEDDPGDLGDHAEEVNSMAEENFFPTEVTSVYNDYSSSLDRHYPNFDSPSSMPTQISGESSFETVSPGISEHEDTSVGKIVGDITVPSGIPSMENHSDTSLNDSDVDTGYKEDQGAFEGQDDSNNNITEDVPTTSEFSVDKIHSIIHSADSSGISLDSSFNLSLEEKVANFIQNGDLDPVEGHVSSISNGDDSQESKAYIESKHIVDMLTGAHPAKDNNVNAHLDQPLRDDHMPHEDLTTHFDKDLDAEAPKVETESEINNLKFMMDQKELELSRLKEQIEKEQRALSVLQAKAEEEISKARKLISEKDVELHVAEESLSGLKEVKIEFCGDGNAVEVAGSFNGWHHRIKMDPQPSTSVIDHGSSRESKLWSTMLWLYPGVYEIKFVVDGHWRTDPQRESVSRGHICNNILRVDR